MKIQKRPGSVTGLFDAPLWFKFAPRQSHSACTCAIVSRGWWYQRRGVPPGLNVQAGRHIIALLCSSAVLARQRSCVFVRLTADDQYVRARVDIIDAGTFLLGNNHQPTELNRLTVWI